MTNWQGKLRRRSSRETGAIFKEWGGRIPVALVYPNTYYVGMSNLGFQNVYAILNSYNRIVCERFFCDGRTNRLFSIESQRPLRDFAIIAFSLSYELDYFNVVKALNSSGIPLFAINRTSSHPLVIAGGPCVTANPAPLSPFFDCFAIGEAEAILPAVIDVLDNGIAGSKHDVLSAISRIPGIYAPLLHQEKTISRQWMRQIDDFATTSVILTPDTEFGSMYVIEATRGCRWGCRFCLAGFMFRPFRYRSVENLLEQARNGLRHGKKIGLLGASPVDHPDIEVLVARLLDMDAEISISSLRIRPLLASVIRGLVHSGAQTITMAPEAGSNRLRCIINKGVTDSDIIEAVARAAEHHVKHLKLYFMVGLPTETDEDMKDIARLTLAMKELIDRKRVATGITLTVEPFVPKAGTPFQWLPMADAPLLKYRLAILKSLLQPKGIHVTSESVNWMTVQGVLSRGDARLAEVLARTDGRSLASWRRAMEKCSLDSEHYANREIPLTESLPWSNIDSGVNSNYLKLELENAFLGRETPPCPPSDCRKCGVC